MASVFKTVQSTTFLAENIWEKCQDHKKLTQSRIGPQGPSGLIIEKYTKNLNVPAPLFTFFRLQNLWKIVEGNSLNLENS